MRIASLIRVHPWLNSSVDRMVTAKRHFCDRFLRYGVITGVWLLSGCTRAPTYDIAGSLFPAWLVCLALGILLTALVHWLLFRRKINIVLPVLVYPCLAALFTFLLWLIFFSR
jgi:hypothetical protein